MTELPTYPSHGRVVPKHLPGVEGANTLVTKGLREIEQAIRDLYDHGGIITIDGEVGTGKTFATQHAGARLDIPVYWADMPEAPLEKEAYALVYEAVSGKEPKRTTTRMELTKETIKVLDGLKAALVIDEAANMTDRALRVMRYLHDRPKTTALFVLIGFGIEKKILRVPELDNRVGRRVTIEALKQKSLLELVPQLHPVLANTERDVLARLTDHAGGKLRNWARVLEVANHLHLRDEAGIDLEAADLIIGAITGRKSR